MRDAIAVQRRLWKGERLRPLGALGSYPYLFLMDDEIAEDIPVLMVALGPKALTLAGEMADAIVLHTFMTDEAVARASRPRAPVPTRPAATRAPSASGRAPRWWMTPSPRTPF